MERFIDILCIATLGILSWQDFRSRKIAWWLLPILAGVFLMSSMQKNSAGEMTREFLLNIIFLIAQFLFLWIWFLIKNKRISKIMDTQIGWGDVLFMICIALAFSPANFLVFYVLGMIATLLATITFRLLRSGKENEIPLAGALALPLIVLICIRLIDPGKNFYNDDWLNSLFDNAI
jgi:hypothetical protein